MVQCSTDKARSVPVYLKTCGECAGHVRLRMLKDTREAVEQAAERVTVADSTSHDILRSPSLMSPAEHGGAVLVVRLHEAKCEERNVPVDVQAPVGVEEGHEGLDDLPGVSEADVHGYCTHHDHASDEALPELSPP
eukprot:CAMPEP_0206013068 /NCGR_PEP_ID=MMETSP1464-20131121/15865_1 /ASSEMBLY_ACC=CAM_ASM_001124 /TAXON_ID=119497 /ORGANISM="Exanthemachrysis gayraliae, Strain RCC1523" /LENGTH=135 /DNA_ID=CAMNT_0053386779 /DNA_START=168 /DNA_END=574 /DNA_ORIENTATION=-